MGNDTSQMIPTQDAAVIDLPQTSHQEAIQQLELFVDTQLYLLKPVCACWQPSDFLPEMASERWREQLQQLRQQAQALPDEVLVVLIGDTVTEEALPSYQTMLNRHERLFDRTGASETPWARWSRGWTAEENRHGELLNKYLYLTGRVDMRAVEITTQHLLRNGFDPRTLNDPYRGLIYTAFQERATKCSHGRVAQLAEHYGNELLGRLCNTIAGDEARHEEAYKRFVKKLIEVDPEGTIVAFADMMRTTIAMPGRLMDEGSATTLFDQFSAIAQRIGVYTTRDYAQIIEHLVAYWDIGSLAHCSDKAAQAQDYLCGLAPRYLKLVDRANAQVVQQPSAPISWLFNRAV